MGEAAHDLRDHTAVDAEIVRRLTLAPAKFEHGMEDVTGGEVVAGELSHGWSLTLIKRIEGTDLNEGTKGATLGVWGRRFLVLVQVGWELELMVLAQAGALTSA